MMDVLPPVPTGPTASSARAVTSSTTSIPLPTKERSPPPWRLIQQVVQGLAGTRIVTQTDHYLHVEFRSKIMGFVDDVEFFFPDTTIIHMRSASRVGYSDFGVNRKRLEKIRQLFQKRQSKDGKA